MEKYVKHDAKLCQDFRRDGYVALPSFVDADELDEILENIERYINEIVPSLPDNLVMYEIKDKPETLKQLTQMQTHDPFFESLFFGSKFEKIAEILLEGPVVGKNMQYFNKPPSVGQPTPPHQDGFYFMIKPNEAVTMWFALEEVDEENGCVRYVRGSHLKPMRPHGRTQTLGFSQGIADFGNSGDIENEIAFPARPGDLLVHHAQTIHRAAGNNSNTRSRRALGFIYYSEKASEDKKAHEDYQKSLSKEMREKGKL